MMIWLEEIHFLRATSDRVLHDKAFNIARNLKYDQYQDELASMVNKFFDKKNHWYFYTLNY